MKKTLTLIFVFIFSSQIIKAQTTGGPDGFGYIWRSNSDSAGPIYNWIDIIPKNSTQVGSLSDDNSVGAFAIGFPFHFYWYDVSSFWIGSNGYLGFTSGQLSSVFANIPSTAGSQNFLAALGADLLFDPLNSAKCYRWTSSNLDTLVVSYLNVPFYDQSNPAGSGNNSFQIILSAVDSSITYQYLAQSGVSPQPNYVIGIENNSGVIGLQHSFNFLPLPGTAIKFYYPTNSTFSVFDASSVYNSNIESAASFVSKNGAAFTMNSNVKNAGNQNLAPFNVNSRVLNAAGTTVVTDNLMTGSLAPGQSQNITMGLTFNPNTAGTFRFRNITQLAGDATPSNNTKEQELIVVDTTTSSILLSYASGAVSTTGWSWVGGTGGVGNYFIPPFYPCKVTDMLAFISANANSVGYTMLINDDDGINGYPGTPLDSVSVQPSAVIINGWNTTPLTTPLTITSGGIYVIWKMDGVGITLGTNQVAPFSNRSFEAVAGIYTPYRNRETDELMINIKIEALPGVGVNENNSENYFVNFYPNPTEDEVFISIKESSSEKLQFSMFDALGKLVMDKKINVENGIANFSVKEIPAGIYFYKLRAGETILKQERLIISN